MSVKMGIQRQEMYFVSIELIKLLTILVYTDSSSKSLQRVSLKIMDFISVHDKH